MSARIEKLIGLASLQGEPITGFRRFGVPTGGGFDQESHRIANALLDNPADALTLELANAVIEVVFSESSRIAIVGAPTSQNSNAAVDILAGHPLVIETGREGLRSYLAVLGGWIPEGIDSALARSGRSLKPGDVLEHGGASPSGIIERLADPPRSLASGTIRVVKGPQPIFDLSGVTLTVSNQSDRTGIRLDGLPPRDLPELASEPACFGAIQLTPSGQLIIIGPDGPTIGGYPKIAVVCSADSSRLAQLRPGSAVQFEEIDLESSRALAAAEAARVSELAARLRLVARR